MRCARARTARRTPVVARLFLGQRQVERQRLIDREHDEEEARRIDADFIDDVGERDDLASALGHRDDLIAALERDLLGDQHFDRAAAAVGVGQGAQARDVAVVIGTENIDHAVGALQLVVVVGDVVREIGRASVGADDHAVFVVAAFGRAQPERAVFVVGEPVVRRRSMPVAIAPASCRARSLCQRSYATPKRCATACCSRTISSPPERGEERKPVGFRGVAPAFRRRGRGCARQSHQVVAGIAFFGNGNAASHSCM